MLSIPFKNLAGFDIWMRPVIYRGVCVADIVFFFFFHQASPAAKRVARSGCAWRWLISVWWICMRERQPTPLTRTHSQHPLCYNNAANPLRIARFKPVIALSLSFSIFLSLSVSLFFLSFSRFLYASPLRILRLFRELYNNAFSGKNFCYGTNVDPRPSIMIYAGLVHTQVYIYVIFR